MNRSEMSGVFAALFPLFFVGMWCGVSMLLSVAGGWRRLAQRYPARGLPTGKRFGWQGARLGWVNYNNCMTIYSSAEGLHLSVWFLFRLGHPPVFIPWEAIRNEQERKVLWVESIRFEVGSPSVVKMELAKKVFEGRRLKRTA